MKDKYTRRREAESKILKPLPTIEPNRTVHPTKQERLIKYGLEISRLDVQENEFIATTSNNWAVAVYELDDEHIESECSSSDTVTESDETLEFSINRSVAWKRIAVGDETMNNVKFIAKSVVASTEQNGRISTWCVRSAQRLDRVRIRNVEFSWAMCKISDEQFVVGDTQGHICLFTHNFGCQVKEIKRIRKAHDVWVSSLACCSNFVLSASNDGTARLWDSRNWRCIATFYHNGPVFNCDLSNRFAMTNSADVFGPHITERRELRIYRIDNNGQNCSLMKYYLAENGIWMPRFVRDDLFMCWVDHEDRREFLAFFKLDTDSDCVVGQVKVGCLSVLDYAFLEDGRLVACGDSRSRGVIATLPRGLRKLITRETCVKRRFCTIVLYSVTIFFGLALLPTFSSSSR